MVVEDNTFQRECAVTLLRGIGFGEVLVAEDGGDALCQLARRRHPVHLVLTDLAMPGMDGFELIRHLTQQHLAEHLIVVSAHDTQVLDIADRLAAGANTVRLLGTLGKPFQGEQLVHMLRSRCQAWEPASTTATSQRMDPGLIREALERRQFVTYFQPKVSVMDGTLKGVEALARWRHPVHGIVAPSAFMPAIEGSEFMLPFTLSIVDQAVRQLAWWQAQGLPGLSMSVNVSSDDVATSGFVELLVEIIERHGAAPARLVCEVTETTVLRDLPGTLLNLGRMRLKGFGLAMDDYGIGYSTMQQLAICPFTELKIDRAFVNGAAQRANRRAILEGAIATARRLGLSSVAEGVESQADWELLHELGADMAQGYFIASPMPGDELGHWLQRRRACLGERCVPATSAGYGDARPRC